MLKNSILFIFFELINKAVPFLLLPVLTRYLAPSDYGVIASFTALVAFLAIFIGLSGHGAVDANFFRLEKNKLGIYVANVLMVLTLTSIVCLVFVLVFSSFIEHKINISPEWQVLAVIVAFGQFVTLINLSLWVIEQKPIQFGIYQVVQTLVITAISLVLVVGCAYNWKGQLLAVIIGTLLLSFVSLVVLFERGYINLKIKKDYIKDFLKFGLPMIPHQLGGWLRAQGNKIVIVVLIGSSATGLFAVGYQLGAVMSILMGALTKALYPVLFRIINKKDISFDEKKRVVRFTYGLFLFIFVITIALIFLIEFLYPYLVGKEFQGSAFLTKLIIVSFMFEGFYYCVVGYIFYFKETAKMARITFSVSIFHILLSILLVYFYGAIGAGLALIASAVVQFFLIWHLSNTVYPMPWFSFWKIR